MMNRRDFLKTLGLALSALALPKLPGIKPKPALTGTAATLEYSTDDVNWTELPGATFKDLGVKGAAAAKDLRAMAEAAVEASKGLRAHSLQDCIPLSDELEEDGTLYAVTLMGYPIVWTGKLTVSPEVPLVFDDWEKWAQ